MNTLRLPHDAAYKQFFSDPSMVASLLRELVAEEFVDELDFSTLERCPGSYVTDDLRVRHDDIVWRVAWKGGGWCYVVLLLEFQSTPDYWMALRMLVYTALLLQDLVKSGQVRENEGLPPVFPVVLYNGSRPWKAPVEVGQLLLKLPRSLRRLRAFFPAFRYVLVDVSRFSKEELAGAGRGPAVHLARLERAEAMEEVWALVRELRSQFRGPRHERLRQMFAVWLDRVVLRRLGVTRSAPELSDLQEVEHMLEERMDQWRDEFIRQGMAQGMAQGMTQGRMAERAEALVDFLESRFGETPQAVLDYLAVAADAEALRRLTRAVYRAASLDEVVALVRQSGH